MVSFRKLIVPSILCGFLAGCASSVDCDVLAFHALSKPAGENIRIQHEDADKMQSPEFKYYASQIAEITARIGYSLAGSAPEDLVFVVDYGVGPGADEIEKLPKCTMRYHFNYGDFSSAYRYGVQCFDKEIEIHATYVHFLKVRVHGNTSGSATPGPLLYEGVVHSVSRRNSLADVMPYLTTALFEDFPGQSGEARSVTIEDADLQK